MRQCVRISSALVVVAAAASAGQGCAGDWRLSHQQHLRALEAVQVNDNTRCCLPCGDPHILCLQSQGKSGALVVMPRLPVFSHGSAFGALPWGRITLCACCFVLLCCCPLICMMLHDTLHNNIAAVHSGAAFTRPLLLCAQITAQWCLFGESSWLFVLERSMRANANGEC